MLADESVITDVPWPVCRHGTGPCLQAYPRRRRDRSFPSIRISKSSL